MIKRVIAILSAFVAPLPAFISCVTPEQGIAVASVMLNKTSLSMIIGDEQTLLATIVPENATDQTIQWSTSDPGVATVVDGVVTAVKEGEAKIVAYVDGKTAECIVTVNYPSVEKVVLDKSSLLLYEGEEYTLTATILPENATYQDITWSTDDVNTAKVEDGKVVAVKKGTAYITAQANGVSAVCQVEVLSAVTAISLDKTELDLIAGETGTLAVILTPEGATPHEDVVWSSSDATVATVDKDGNVKAVDCGTATITAAVEGKTAECIVTVIVPVSSVSLDRSTLTLIIGKAATLVATVNPSDATDKTLSWSTSDPSVATVIDGVVEAIGAGTADITVIASGKTAKCSVTVAYPFNKDHFQGNAQYALLENGNEYGDGFGPAVVKQIAELPDAAWIPTGVTAEELVGLQIDCNIPNTWFGEMTFKMWVNTQDLTLIMPDQVSCSFEYGSYGTYDVILKNCKGEVDTLNEEITFYWYTSWGPYSFGGELMRISFGEGGSAKAIIRPRRHRPLERLISE